MPETSRLARLLLAVGSLQLLAVATWLAWRSAEAPGQAVAGAVAIVFFAPLVLALEFVLLALVGRGDKKVAAPTAAQLVRAWIDESRHLFRVFYWRLPFAWRLPPDHLDATCVGRRGVVFIHGFVCNRGFWSPWTKRLQKVGTPYVAVNLEPVFTSIDDYVPAVEEAVRRLEACTGVPPVIVCHSMGGLVARAWLRVHRRPQRVASVVTIGSPHRGTWLGRFSSMPNGRQMQLESEWVQDLERDERAFAPPPFTCWYSNCDNIVFPVTTATLPGADNRFLPGRAHVALAFTPAVMAATLAAVQVPKSALPM